jgi:hypothetical protein|uniref:Uncharacterized protein n=1 Tax=viral metagenome TaxID=1070528 RepID=A0A6C0F0F8_9ZZZZ
MKLLGISSSKLAPIAFLFAILVAALILSNVDFLKFSNSATLPSLSEGLTEGADEEEEEGMEGEEKEEEGMEGEEKDKEKEKTPEEVLAAVEGFEGFDKHKSVSEYTKA